MAQRNIIEGSSGQTQSILHKAASYYNTGRGHSAEYAFGYSALPRWTEKTATS